MNRYIDNLSGEELNDKLRRSKRSPKKKKKYKNCDPSDCDHCQYIGDGDFLCTMYNKIVVEDWTPSNNYLYCDPSNH